jgi:hypothetical protein
MMMVPDLGCTGCVSNECKIVADTNMKISLTLFFFEIHKHQ